MHADPQHIPFLLALLPFIAVGISIPPSIQDWMRGQPTGETLKGMAVIFGLGAAWYWVIFQSVRSKRKQGALTAMGRSLDAWLWAPPATFLVGVGCGFALL